MYSVPALPKPGVLADPNAFFSSDAGESWLGQLADEFPHSRYWRDRSDSWSLKSLNALAARIIDARYEGHDVDEAILQPLWHAAKSQPLQPITCNVRGRSSA